MNKHLQQILTYALGITTTCFSFFPEEFFSRVYSWGSISDYWSGAINRILFLLLVWVLTGMIMSLFRSFSQKHTIKGQNYKVIIEYGDIFKQANCKKVINFDECYTSEIGSEIHQVNPSSLCGQFLQKYMVNVTNLISNRNLTPTRKRSDYNGNTCYESGTILPYNDFLLMAFSKLDRNGRAAMTREEYLFCLSTLWKEIDKYYAQTDVAIPVLGSGLTRFNGEMLSQQQLVDMIIASYQLSPYKIKSPNALHIICKNNEDFSLNKIGENL